MAYRSDLYYYRNIIGYTGSLHQNPTVYFRSDQLGLVGRITQAHSRYDNVGRGAPRSTVGYEGRNQQVNGVARYVECINGEPFHHSRNAFIRVGGFGPGQPQLPFNTNVFAILAQSIRLFPFAKPRVYEGRATWSAFHAKNNAMRELKDIAALDDTFKPSRVAIHAQITSII